MAVIRQVAELVPGRGDMDWRLDTTQTSHSLPTRSYQDQPVYDMALPDDLSRISLCDPEVDGQRCPCRCRRTQMASPLPAGATLASIGIYRSYVLSIGIWCIYSYLDQCLGTLRLRIWWCIDIAAEVEVDSLCVECGW
jgi:hypothetical protein